MKIVAPSHFVWLVLVVCIAALHQLLPRDFSQRNYEVMNTMVDTAAYNTLEPNPHFANGMTLQSPPEHSISRGAMPYTYPATKEGAIQAGAELSNPIADDDAAALIRGAKVFRNFCVPCHGPGGMGDGAVTKRRVPPPPSLLADQARDMPDGQMYHIITRGQGNMASYASQVGREDRWKVIKHIRSLQRRP